MSKCFLYFVIGKPCRVVSGVIASERLDKDISEEREYGQISHRAECEVHLQALLCFVVVNNDFLPNNRLARARNTWPSSSATNKRNTNSNKLICHGKFWHVS